MFKLGRKPAVHNLATMRSALMLAPMLDALGAAPRISTIDWRKAVNAQTGGDWSMLGNDVAGDCLTGDTLVESTGVRAAFRVPYNGLLVAIKFASGKRLTVTANHQVLTKHGFVAAKNLKQFDYAIGALGADVFARLCTMHGKNHIDNAPAKAVEIFSTLAFAGNPIREVVPTTIDFHGDERFADGDIDVVTTHGHLRHKFDPTLHQPNRKHQISPARQLKRPLYSLGATLKRYLSSRLPTFGDVRISDLRFAGASAHASPSHGSSFGQPAQFVPGFNDSALDLPIRHAAFSSEVIDELPGNVSTHKRPQVTVSRSDRLEEGFDTRSEFAASSGQATVDGLGADANLAGNLLKTFPGLVTLDRIIDIDSQWFHGFVYEVSTDEKWYAANGILTHNCTFADCGHALMLRSANASSIVIPTTQDVLGAYSASTGYDPTQTDASGNNPTDQGADENQVCNFMFHTGLLGHKSAGYGMIDPMNQDHIRWTVEIFGACRLGITVGDESIDQFKNKQPWTTLATTNQGGHDVPVVYCDEDYAWVVTWAGEEAVAWELMAQPAFLQEAHVEVFPDFVETTGTSPSGFSLQELVDKMHLLRGST